MRTGPVALAFIGDRDAVARLAADVAALTHPHPDSVDACVLWSLAIEQAITTARPTSRSTGARRSAPASTHIEPAPPRRCGRRGSTTPPVATPPTSTAATDGSSARSRRRSRRSRRPPTTTTRCRATTSPRRCGAAARAGGDTDTVAAIAGSLLGARWGATAIPLAGAAASTAGAPTTQPTVSGARLDALARLAVRGGRPDAQGWPGVAPMDYGRMERAPRRARRRLVRQLRRPRRRGRRRRDRGRLAVPDGRRRRARRPSSTTRSGSIDTRPGRQPEHHPRPARHRADDRRPRRRRRAGLRPLRPRRAPRPDDGRRLPHHPRRRRRRRPSAAPRTALGGAPQPFMRDALVEVERIVRTAT